MILLQGICKKHPFGASSACWVQIWPWPTSKCGHTMSPGSTCSTTLLLRKLIFHCPGKCGPRYYIRNIYVYIWKTSPSNDLIMLIRYECICIHSRKKKSDLFLYIPGHCPALHMHFWGLQRCFWPERTCHKDEVCVHRHEQGLGNKYIMIYKLPEQHETAARFFPSF